jgi:hypothetical protein
MTDAIDESMIEDLTIDRIIDDGTMDSSLDQ